MKHLWHQNHKKDVYDGDIWHMTMISGHSGVALGHVGGTLGIWICHLGHLGSLWGYFGSTLGALWGHFWVMKVALGDLEGALGSFCAHFELTFGM